ncbi:MAG: glycoside hydrolase family 1 protein [Bacteriovoracaceae bacterium]|nr:glycoside hydrolase family 1 protein [Bacteriovoracaceae bacterium]
MKTTLLLLMMSFSLQAQTIAQFPKDFFFGVANAPVQVEDQLEGAWIHHARDGKIPAFYNYVNPEERIRFWTEPERELDMAQELGLSVFRLGLSWKRLFPSKDTKKPDPKVIKRYKEIFQMIKKRNMKIMVSLFHHAEPDWTIKEKSWVKKSMVNHFMRFSKTVVDNFGDDIDYWVTFNESNLYALMTQVVGTWPSYHQRRRPLSFFNLGPIKGSYERALKNMARGHNQIYDYIKSKGHKAPIGIAQNVGDYVGQKWISKYFAGVSKRKMNYKFYDLVSKKMDYIGVNYYGAEVVKGTTLALSKDYEYSDSGRAVSPNGFYKVIKELHKRYNLKKKRNLPFIITENGVADEKGWLRSSYMVEHLLALNTVMKEGIKVLGYMAWSLSDNWEWADGYCPKFGMVAVDRSNNLQRTKRDGFFLYQKISKTKKITASQRTESWKKVLNAVGKDRAFCRSKDGETALNEPRQVKVRDIDWRFKK